MTAPFAPLLVLLMLLAAAAPSFAQSKPLPPVVGITSAEIDAVLKHTGR